MLTAFTDNDDSMKAFHALEATLERTGSKLRRTVGWQGGNTERCINWHGNEGFWSLIDEQAKAGGRFWFLFGAENALTASNLKITVEINPLHIGTNLRVAGAFAYDAEGAVHLCHNGNIGGGRPGIGKRGFWQHYSGDWTQMAHGEKQVCVVDLGSIRDEGIVQRLGWFVNEVKRIKGNLVACGQN